MKKIETDNFLNFKFLSNPLFSKDGRYLSLIVKEADLDNNSYKSNLYLKEDNNKIKCLTETENVFSSCWTFQNSLIFSVSKDKNDKGKIEKEEGFTTFYEISPNKSKTTKAFTLPIKAKKIESIDDKRFLVSAVYDNKCSDEEILNNYENSAYDVIDELPFWGNDKGILSGKRTRLYIYNRKEDSLKAVTSPLFDVEDYSFGDGKIAICGGSYKGLRFKRKGVYCYHIKSGEMQCIISPDSLNTGSAHIWGEDILITATKGEKFGSEEYCDFYLYNLVKGKMTKLADYDGSIDNGTVNSDMRLGIGKGSLVINDKFYFLTIVRNSTFLCCIDKLGRIEEVITPDGSVDSFDIFDEKIAYVGMVKNSLQELYLNSQQITSFNDFTEEYSVREPQIYTFKATDGFIIDGWVIKPLGYEKGKIYPAILYIQDDPHTVFGNVYHHDMQILANAGYFVFYANPRGSNGRGAEFRDIKGKFGGADYENLMEFADYMLKKFPDVDEKRFGLIGGFMTDWIIGHTDRFAAAVSQGSISNWISFEHTADIGYFFAEDIMGTNTRTDVDKLWLHSPLHYADKVKTPTLFIQGDLDYRCWKVEALSMFTSLKLHGTKARFCLFKDENHNLSRSGKPQNRIRRMEEILSWMDMHFKN